MTKKERVIEAIRHKETDIVPYNIELTSGLLKSTCEVLKIDPKEYNVFVGNHMSKLSYNIGGALIKPEYFKDEFGVIWNRSGLDKDIGMVDEIILKEATLDGYEFPEPPLNLISALTKNFVENEEDTFKLGKIGLAFYERAWSLRGTENLLMDFYLNPEFVEQLLDKILEYNLKILDVALEYDLDGFYFGDDYGQQRGMIMGPQLWRKFIKPGLAQMFAKVKKAGKVVALHSCGDISDILEDLIEIGLDIYQTFQPEIYDINEIKSLYGDRLTFWGGISTQQMLPNLSPKELVERSGEILKVMSQKGGYIMAPTHQVPEDVPVENILELIKMCKNQRILNRRC
ncbi:MAG: uroporphyrinogen decarboxylase [Vallitaleaceae bacterium]|nr:uroporphyrinogen decarboxylase [Vallitaleaceae bacterium]